MTGRRRNVVHLPLGRIIGPMQARIRKLAAQTGCIKLSDHALDQMWDRDISDIEVFRVLRLGDISGLPWIEPKGGEHGCKVVLRRAGSRAIGVVTILLKEEVILVKTVEWEDER